VITKIHVNQHAIRANQGKRGQPVITVKDYQRNRKTDEARIIDANGNVVARIVYNPDKPLDCGAKCWVETSLEVRT
jgi:hypothetical protein